MVQDPVGPIVIRIGTPNNTYQRQILTIRPRDRVQHAEPADGERDDARADAPAARVAVGGVAGVELVAAADDVELRLRDEVVEERQVEVPRDGEHVRDANLDQAPRQVPAQGGVTGAHDGGGDRVLDGRNGAV